jgi:hypothetical protein
MFPLFSGGEESPTRRGRDLLTQGSAIVKPINLAAGTVFYSNLESAF